MNPIELNESLLDQFDLFSKNKLPAKDMKSIQTKLEEDPTFRSSYEAFLLCKEVIEIKIASGLRYQMEQWKLSQSQQSGTIIELPKSKIIKALSWYKWAAAASILLFLSFSYYKLQDLRQIPDQMIADLLEIPESGTRGEDVNINSLDAIAFKYKDQPALAIDQIKNLPTVAERRSQSYLGKFYVRINKFDLAEQSFIQAKILGDPDAEIGIFLTQYKAGNTGPEFQKRLDVILSNENYIYRAEALKIKRNTNSIWWKLLH